MIKDDGECFPPELVAFVRLCCTFGSDWNGGYAFDNAGVNYAERGGRSLAKQIQKLRDVQFFCGNYWELPIPAGARIYCDPPYRSTLGYKDVFDSDKFWDWVRLMSDCGQQVFVSEYDAPEDFLCVVEIEHKTTINRTALNKHVNKPRVERLFVYAG